MVKYNQNDRCIDYVFKLDVKNSKLQVISAVSCLLWTYFASYEKTQCCFLRLVEVFFLFCLHSICDHIVNDLAISILGIFTIVD